MTGHEVTLAWIAAVGLVLLAAFGLAELQVWAERRRRPQQCSRLHPCRDCEPRP
jgi:hypothetical protein